MFPARGGCSKTYSPREILHHLPLDYDTQCRIPTLSQVVAHDEPQTSNTNQARAIDAIYLRPLNNAQGGHELYDMTTHQLITRRNVTEVPMTTPMTENVSYQFINIS